MAKKDVAQEPGLETRLKPTGMHHIFHFDVLGDGRFREVAVVKMVRNQDKSIRSVYYIDVALLDTTDKGRLKGIITNRHADKYELWDIMSQVTLSNGKNALDYFHQLTRVEHGKGAINTSMGGGLGSVAIESGGIIGSEFSDPGSGVIDPTL